MWREGDWMVDLVSRCPSIQYGFKYMYIDSSNHFLLTKEIFHIEKIEACFCIILEIIFFTPKISLEANKC